MESLVNLEKLTKDAAKKITPYMKQMLKIHNGSIISIFIYGSACGADYIKGVSDINSAIIFKELGLDELKRSLHIVDKGIRKKIVAPLFLTKEHILTSGDTFPIEFSRMKESHILIYGEDILKDLAIEPKHIRFICEQQLKGKLIRIRQAYLEIGLRKRGLEALIKESLGSLFPVFRGLLMLKGITRALDKQESLKALSETFGVDTAVFKVILEDRRNNEKIGGQDIEIFLSRYIEQIEKLAVIADKL
jgi:hypothetical protein